MSTPSPPPLPRPLLPPPFTAPPPAPQNSAAEMVAEAIGVAADPLRERLLKANQASEVSLSSSSCSSSEDDDADDEGESSRRRSSEKRRCRRRKRRGEDQENNNNNVSKSVDAAPSSVPVAAVARTAADPLLCLHYFSSALKFEFGDHADVHRLDSIKEWAEVEDPIWLDYLKEKLRRTAGGETEL